MALLFVSCFDVKCIRELRSLSVRLLVFVGVLLVSCLSISSVNASSASVGSIGFLCHKIKGIQAIFRLSLDRKPYVVTIVNQSDTAYQVEFDWNYPPGYSKGDSIWIPRDQFSYIRNCESK